MRKFKDSLLAYAMLSPALLVLGLFGIFPVGYAFFVSLHKWRLRPGAFIGLGNYAEALGDLKAAGMLVVAGLAVFLGLWIKSWARQRGWSWLARSAGAFTAAAAIICFSAGRTLWLKGDPTFMNGLKITVFHAMVGIPIQLSIALVLAFILNQKLRARGAFRTIFFLPYVTPLVASALLFKSMMNARDLSFANRVIGAVGCPPLRWFDEAKSVVRVAFEILGLPAPGPWVEEAFPSLALASIISYNIWVFVGYDIVILLAGLSTISPELFDAARIDGANNPRILRHVVIPLLSPTLYFLSMVAVIGTFRAFNHIYVLRTPAARKTVDSASVVIFNEFFKAGNAGYASALALVLFAIILTITLLQRRVFGKRVFYG